MCSVRQDLVNKGVLPAPGKPWFTRGRVATPRPEAQWQVQLPNGTLVSFSGAMPVTVASANRCACWRAFVVNFRQMAIPAQRGGGRAAVNLCRLHGACSPQVQRGGEGAGQE